MTGERKIRRSQAFRLGRRFSAVLLIGILTVFGSSSARAQDEQRQLEQKQQEMRSVETDLNKAKKSLDRTEKQEKDVVSHLDRLDRDAVRSRKALEEIKTGIEKTKEDLKETEVRVKTLKEEVKKIEKPYEKRLVSLYRSQRAGYPAMILNAKDLNDAYRTYRYLMEIVRQDVDDIKEALSKIAKWEAAKTRLTEEQDRLKNLEADKKKHLEELDINKRDKKAALARIRDEKTLREQTVGELQKASDQLKEIIQALSAKVDRPQSPPISNGALPFTKLKGKLPSPVEGDVKVQFGKQIHPLLKTFTVQNGIEIGADAGDPIRAVHSGIVAYAGWVKGYGNVLIIDHGDGYYTLSGHAASLNKVAGDPIQQGEVVGQVGESGSIVGPSLYFEIRKNGIPQDPLDWIRSPSSRQVKK